MSKLDQLVEKLEELFELDKADLDFGIHRIIKSKHTQIKEYLSNRLPEKVQSVLSELKAEEGNTKLEELKKQLKDEFGKRAFNDSDELIDIEAKESELGKEYLKLLTDKAGNVNINRVESEVYSHLYEFFSRYYEDGDFISLRRHSNKQKYAIPYNGEEVVLHWANKDQYYIKSSEDMKDYTFTIHEEDKQLRVKFKLTKMDAVQNNNKAIRSFALDEEKEIESTEDTLVIPFYFKLFNRKPTPKQLLESLTNELSEKLDNTWKEKLWQNDITYTGKDTRTLLEKHLQNYTKKNTSDYFIHKDLGGFLRNELDFYIKNEVMYLDDIDNRPANYLDAELRKIKAIRTVAKDLIDFLAQFEDFQKKLWLKKKFVIETNYCITLDKIPEVFYEEIAANDSQREEWIKLFAIDEIEGSTVEPTYSIPLSKEFLKANKYLVLDTFHFNINFKYSLLEKIDDLESLLDGRLIHSENYQGLGQIIEKYKGTIKCIYIDPPYNTGQDEFIYKDDYKESTWLSMMYDRIKMGYELLNEEGCFLCSIDDEELHNAINIFDFIFGQQNHIATIVVKMSRATGVKMAHEEKKPVRYKEFLLLYAKNKERFSITPQYIETDELDTRYNKFISNVESQPSEWLVENLSNVLRNNNVEAEVDKKLFYKNNSNKICRLAANDQDVFQATKGHNYFEEITTTSGLKRWAYNGQKVLFYNNKLKKIGEEFVFAENAGDLWVDIVSHINDLMNEGGVSLPNGKKPEFLLSRIIEMVTNENDIILDFCLGTGTSTAVAHKHRRQWIGIEGMNYFDTLPLIRMKNTLYGEQRGISKATNWQGGGSFTHMKLEAYEDVLNNLEFEDKATDLIGVSENVQDEYLLKYSLDIESKNSLLNLEKFADPFNYKLKIYNKDTGEAEPKNVDLPETFNYLLGLKVREIRQIDGFLTIEGENPNSETVLVIWRNINEKDNTALETFVTQTLRINTADTEYKAIYINGDSTLNDPHKKIMLTEEVFHNLMFDVKSL